MAANLAEGPGSGSVRCSEGSLVVLVLLVVLHHVAMITWKKETDFDLLCADIFEQSPSSRVRVTQSSSFLKYVVRQYRSTANL